MPADLDTDRVWVIAADALHADSEHAGDWRDGVCACDDDAAVVLKAARFDVLVAELRAAREVVETARKLDGETICEECYESACAAEVDDEVDDETCGLDCDCHGKQKAVTAAIDAYDNAVKETTNG